MFIKSLKIDSNIGVIRNIEFRRGLNFILDETPDHATATGNNVGKTTVLKLIDFCLGKDEKVIYSDPNNLKEIHKEVKQFIEDKKIVITLVLTHDFSKDDVVIVRNFAKRSKAIREINGQQFAKNDLFEEELGKVVFNLKQPKPTFRQLISHNFRYTDTNIGNLLKTLNGYTTGTEYETLYLYMFGCQYDAGDERLQWIEKLNTETNFKKKLEEGTDKGKYKSLLGLVDAQIISLNEKRANLCINPDYEDDLDRLTEVKYELNVVCTEINSLNIRKGLINEILKDVVSERSQVDLKQLSLIYKQANALIPNLQRNFEELVAYHNEMIENRAIFVSKELPTIDEKLFELKNKFDSLRSQEMELSNKVIKSETYADLEQLIDQLNESYKQKGEYEKSIQQIESAESKMDSFNEKIRLIDNKLFSEDFKSEVQKKIDIFNVYFSNLSQKLYDESYAIKFDVVQNKLTHVPNYKFSSFSANISSGKKQGEISCFDIAYIQFADNQGIPCLHFVLNDKKELMSDNQLKDLAEIVNNSNIQFVISMLEDKLPDALKDPKLAILKLSQSDKLFRIEQLLK